MTTEQELRSTIDTAQRELESRFQTAQLEAAHQNRIAQIDAAQTAVDRIEKEIANLEQKIEEAALKIDGAIKARFESRMPYVAVGVSTAVNNTAQEWIGLKDAWLRKMQERTVFVSRHAELVRIEVSSTPKD